MANLAGNHQSTRPSDVFGAVMRRRFLQANLQAASSTPIVIQTVVSTLRSAGQLYPR